MESPGVVVDYDPTWPMVFEDLRARLAPALVGIATSIEHVGSTAVPGLAAKPIIDMDVVVPDAALVPTAIARLETLGYVHQGDLGISGREAFRPPIGGPYHHLYVVVEGTRPHRDHVDLRDYLRRHPDEAARYATRKQEVAHLLQTNREAYVTAKAGLVEEMLVQARGTVEETFHGREHGDRVVRIGDTVRRPTGPWTPTVHAFLGHLHDRGFDACPAPLGIDDEGREILTFIPGLVVQDPDWDGGATASPTGVRTDETLIAVGETIRRFHDAAVGFAPPEEWAWRQWAHALGPGERVCHGDLGHWNTVHRPDGGAAFIDWDSIRPDLPDLEFADAAWRFVPLADDDFLRDTGWPEPPDIARRLRLFCDAYSIRGNDRVLDLLHRSKERWPERFRWWPIGPSESAALLRQTAAELEWLDGVAPRLRAALR